MATFSYADLIATVDAIMPVFGFATTLRKRAQSGTAYEPTITNSDSTVTVVDDESMATGLQEELKRKVYISGGESVAPEVNDQILLASEWHTILDVQTVRPGNVAVLYICEVER